MIPKGKRAVEWTALALMCLLLAVLWNPLLSDTIEKLIGPEYIIKRFNQIYFNSGLYNETKWMGVASAQNPCDNWVVQEIIYDVNPDFIIETGTYKGGSTLFYANMLDNVNRQGKVITVDIVNSIDKKARDRDVFKKRVEFILGSSVAAEVIGKIEKKVRNHKVLVILDSRHSKEHVLKELELYSGLVSVGSYIVVNDTNINGHPVLPGFGPGPMEAVEEFLKTDSRFKIDHGREKFLLTFYPSGFLRRVK